MTTRRARLQVKPNLGPRLARSQTGSEDSATSSKETNHSASESCSGSDVQENIQRTFTQLKEINARTVEKTVPISNAGSSLTTSHAECVPAGTISRSPKKVPCVEAKKSDCCEVTRNTSEESLDKQPKGQPGESTDGHPSPQPKLLSDLSLQCCQEYVYLTCVVQSSNPGPILLMSAKLLEEPTQKLDVEGNASDSNQAPGQSLRQKNLKIQMLQAESADKVDMHVSDTKPVGSDIESDGNDAASASQSSLEQDGEATQESMAGGPSTGRKEEKRKVSERDIRKKEPRSKPSAITSNVETPNSDVVDGESSNQSASLPVPQVKIGPDGNIILNTDSLIVNNPATEPSMSSGDLVEEEDDQFINCSSFRDYKRPKLWSKNETQRFFKALSMVGTDFSLMCSIFPSRSRKELKNKFKKEERHNRPLIDKALRERQSFNMQTFESAKAEDEEENRRCEAAKEEKQKKRIKKEKELDEGEDEERESEMDEEDGDGRKENKKHSGIKRTASVGGEEGFSGYERKRRRVQPSSGHAHEVADILVNMSQGKTTHSNEDDRMSISSDRDSAVELVEEAFVPKIARCSSKSNSAHTSLSGANIIVDAHVHVPEMVTNIYTDSLYPLDHSESTSQTQISAELLEQQPNSVRTTTQEQTAPTPSQNSDQQSMSVGDLYNMGLPPEVIQMMERQQADLIMMENQATGEVVMYMVSRQTADIALPGAQSLQAAGLDPSHNIMRETLQQSLMTGQSQVHGQGMEALPGIVTQVANNCALHKTSAGAAAAFQKSVLWERQPLLANSNHVVVPGDASRNLCGHRLPAK
ncbi:hypothetical protein C0Q70_04948 [Pomacea canaliculata]|uniref:Myb-like domain-containing protein n=1 Tax=Pomacea canaliculata TaxID=400727 RepID=A0A2T7PJV7_POMCA|nr:hypothetical protein C0Q70_04948 [Pomacea canaliculata]